MLAPSIQFYPIATMVYLQTFITTMAVPIGGFYLLCSKTFSEDNWTAPACLVSYFSSAVALILALAVDVIDTRKHKLIHVEARDELKWTHEWMVAMPYGDPIWCNEYNLSSSVPHNVWLNVTHLNTGVTSLVRHNGSDIDLDIPMDGVERSAGLARRATEHFTGLAKRSEQTLKRLWVNAKKMEKLDYTHASLYKKSYAEKDADRMWRLGRYCQHIYACDDEECSELIDVGFTLNSGKQTYERQSVKGCEADGTG